jgi:CRISPR-associated endonuclease Cas2
MLGTSRRIKNRDLINLTEDLFGRSVDAALSLIVYITALSLTPSRRGDASFRARVTTEEFLNTINYEVIKNALITATKNKFITKKRHAIPAITASGKHRLQDVLPHYDEIRTWDHRLHAITYDIPETKHKTRDRLRVNLYRMGCAKLQESVWVTPYNPIDILREFVKQNKIEGTVIVSDLGKDASIGDESMHAVIVRLYNIASLNDRYIEWLQKYANSSMTYIAFIQYMAILRDDPQLPFALLPPWWKGGKAYEKIKPLLRKMSIRSRPRSH